MIQEPNINNQLLIENRDTQPSDALNDFSMGNIQKKKSSIVIAKFGT